MKKSLPASLAAFCLLALASAPLLAKVSAAEAEKLGRELTCMGAEKA